MNGDQQPDVFFKALEGLMKSGTDAIRVFENEFLRLSAEMDRAAERTRQVRLQWEEAGRKIADECRRLRGGAL